MEHKIRDSIKLIERLENKNNILEEALQRINNWANAYPLDSFPEISPKDWQKADKILKENGLNLSAISSSNMRRVIEGVKNIVENALFNKLEGK